METVSNKDLYNLITEGNTTLREEIKEIKKDITADINTLKINYGKLEEENRRLKKQIYALERNQKKFKLFVYGLDGSEEDTEANIIKIINQDLGLNCNTTDFRDTYRIGKKDQNKPRPTIIEVLHYSLREKILRQSIVKKSLLQNKRIGFAPDYTTDEYKKRKELREHLNIAKEKNYTAKINNKKLLVNGNEYSLDQLNENPFIYEVAADEKTDENENGKGRLENLPSKLRGAIAKKVTRYGRK